ncbi:MAG: hypothetical protein CSA96_10235 [Bacteroidetes bacterium]|nr:MAG: hypothetical protein CSA96_10235 [Bacteroidota bacterium]
MQAPGAGNAGDHGSHGKERPGCPVCIWKGVGWRRPELRIFSVAELRRAFPIDGVVDLSSCGGTNVLSLPDKYSRAGRSEACHRARKNGHGNTGRERLPA